MCSKSLPLVDVLTIFTAGNRISGSDSKSLDGRISSLVILACIVAPSIVVMVVSASHNSFAKSSQNMIRIVLIMCTLAGVIPLVLFSVPYFRRGVAKSKRIHDVSKRANTMSSVRLFFLLLFAMGFCAQNILTLILDFLPANITDHHFGPIYRISALVFCIGQSLFLYVHRQRVIIVKNELIIRYGMILIIAADASNWFHTILNESQELYNHAMSSSICNSNLTLNTTSTRSDPCILAHLIEKTDPILSPMVIEFCLLSVGLLLRLWSNTVEKEKSLGNYHGNSTFHDVESTSPKAGMFGTSRDSYYLHGIRKRDENKTNPYHALLTTLGLFGTMFLFVIKYVVFEIDKRGMYSHYEVVQSVYISSLLLCSVFSFYIASKYYEVGEVTKPLKVREYLLIFCCFGTIFYLMFTVIAGAMSFHNDGYGRTICIEFIIDCLSVFFQTTMMLLAPRLQYRARLRDQPVFALSNVFVAISTLNLALWSVDSFVTSTNPSSSNIQHDFYGDAYWYFVAKVVFPFTVYFRFHSFIDFMELSLRVYSYNMG